MIKFNYIPRMYYYCAFKIRVSWSLKVVWMRLGWKYVSVYWKHKK